MTPRLIALTEHARLALKGNKLLIEKFPFRMGRESRSFLSQISGFVERRVGSAPPNNDIYIEETGELFHLSREHVMFEADGGEFFITDLGSACGTIVEGIRLGGDREGGRTQLHDHDVIIMGTPMSPYVFKFRTS
jgi:pSer/pThr/pTyr-binding forkhead associated (FHA) protein